MKDKNKGRGNNSKGLNVRKQRMIERTKKKYKNRPKKRRK
jgi:hypothetical protein